MVKMLRHVPSGTRAQARSRVEKHRFFEFFAGAGMARAGLGPTWQCLFANDFDRKKGRVYAENWGASELKIGDVGALTTADLPGDAELAWASFPCQDLSLAGGGAGLRGDRSGTFWPFWKLMSSLTKEGRAPSLIVLENVGGTLTSHDGKDFTAICGAFRQAGYRVGALVIDAAYFVPQSRPRLFIIGTRTDMPISASLEQESSGSVFHTTALVAAYNRLPSKTRDQWVWWRLPAPPPRSQSFADIIEESPTGVSWFSREATEQLLSMMSEINRKKVAKAQRSGRRMVGGVYRRTRFDSKGQKVQRAEIRFDDVAGCLRTPAGGSSRQTVLIVDGRSVRARLLSTRETARLMGLPDSYRLPENYNEAYHLTGDGVVVPVVRHLADHILEPLLERVARRPTVAA
jgi:DNA (cytosine-5)-methyltransferase 1